MRPQVPPLFSVTLLFSSKTAFLDLPHVVDAVSVYLDTSVELRLDKACGFGSVRLLNRIWDSSQNYADGYTDDSWTLRKFLRTDKHYKQYQFSSCLEDAVPRQNLEMVKWLSTKFQGFTVKSEVVARACKAGAMDILEFFYENDSRFLEQHGARRVGHPVVWGEFSISAAVQSRRSDIVWWLHRHVPDADFNLVAALTSALTTGDIIMAGWLIEHGAVWPEGTDGHAAVCGVTAQGRLDVVQWLAERGRVDGVTGLVASAAEKGHLEVVRWLMEQNNGTDNRHPDPTGDAVLGIHAMPFMAI